MKVVYFVIPTKMRRNLKLVIFLSITWMFFMVYYFQSSTTKVRFVIMLSNLTFFALLLI